jgi:uncharacterized membrane protein
MCRLGGEVGVDVPALVVSEQIFNIAGDRRRLVYLPTSPLPAWGGLAFVPESALISVPEMDADALIKLYISFGVLGSESIPKMVTTPDLRGATRDNSREPDIG